jgi:hypothetical protein
VDLELTFRNLYLKQNDKKKAKEIIQPFISNMLSELKAISYKLPIFNKKINNLVGIIKGETGDEGYRVETPNDSNLLTLEDLQ